MTLRVDFGGTGHGGEWVTVNVDGQGIAHPAPDIVADVTNAFDMLSSGFEQDTIDEAQCVATFEHLPAHLLVETLRMWRTLLKPDARLLIMVPDMRRLAEDWLAGRISNKTYMDCVFSPPEWTQKAPGEVHRYGFDADLLIGMLTEAGYRDAQVDTEFHPDMVFYVGSYVVPNLTVIAWK